PAHGGLRGFAFSQHSLAQRQLAERVIGAPRGEALAREIRRPAERVADADIPESINGRAGHPPVKTIGRISALLTQADGAAFVDPKFVPPPPPPSGRCID